MAEHTPHFQPSGFPETERLALDGERPGNMQSLFEAVKQLLRRRAEGHEGNWLDTTAT
jgi:hypothetical protein